MAWNSIIEQDDLVNTPEGHGVVRRVSSNGTVQVAVNGQLFEFPEGSVTKSGQGTPAGTGEGEDFKPEGVPFKENKEITKGTKVITPQTKKTGKIIRETQRSVDVKWDKDGRVTNFRKKQDVIEKEKILKQVEQGEQEQPEPKRAERTQEQVTQDTAEDLYGLLQLKQRLEKKIDDSVDGELKELREAVKKNQKLEVKIGDKTNVIEGLRHKQLEQLLHYAMLRLSPLLVGMAGTGKTHAGQQVSEALGLNFYAISVGAQTTKTDIMGYTDANGKYVRTHFRDAYERGGVFLMDEIDAGNANVLITINAALSNGLAAFPDAMVEKHPDFVFIASANTFGNGANRQYVGRNQLDAATLDRFAIIEWSIDDDLEESLSFGLNGKAWYMAVRAARDYVAEKNIRALISPRATQKGSALLDIGQDLNEVIDATMLGSVPDDKKADVRQVATSIFNKFASEVPKELPVEVDPPTAADLVQDAFPEIEVPF